MAYLIKGLIALNFYLLTAIPAFAAVSRQVVYLFGDERALVLVGNRCEGTLFYVDDKQKFATEVTSGFKVSLFTFIHPSKKYIAILNKSLTEIATLVIEHRGSYFYFNDKGKEVLGKTGRQTFKILPGDVLILSY